MLVPPATYAIVFRFAGTFRHQHMVLGCSDVDVWRIGCWWDTMEVPRDRSTALRLMAGNIVKKKNQGAVKRM